MSNPSRGTIGTLANLLQARRGRPGELSWVLVLGAGASIRSGCPPLLEIIKQIIEKYGNKEVLSRSGEEQIEEFYRVVDGLDDQNLWLVLDELFANAQPSRGYECLAHLLKDGYFDVILSTNVDTLMEKALEKAGLSLVSDVDVVDCGWIKEDTDPKPIIRRLENPTPQIKLVKLHGHLPARQLKFRIEDMFNFPEKLAEAVEECVSNRLRGVVIVGHSLRDEDLNECLHREGGAIWYINPQRPAISDFAGKVMATRPGSHYIDSEDGDFDRFFGELLRWVQSPKPPDEVPPSVGFLNRWDELRDIKMRLSLPRYPPVTVVSGPMGYGKTYLLREAVHELKGEGWDCALLECEKLADQDAMAVMSALASKLNCHDVADWEQIGACLGQRITDQTPQYRAILLMDGIDWLSASVRRQVLMGVQTVHECVKEVRGECRVVLSGRCMGDDLDWVAEEALSEGSLPFGSPGRWYTEIPLSEFGKDVIEDLIKRVAKRKFESWEYDVMSRSLLEITGGHPKGLVDIVTKDLDRTGWTFGKKSGTKRFYFTPKTNERLFTTYMTDVVKEIKAKIGEQWWADFQAVCVLRRFTVRILEYLITAGAIRQFAKWEALLGWLASHNLVREKSPGIWGDAIARGVVVAEMKMVAGNRKRYGELNQMAADSFSGSLDRLCQVHKPKDTPELEASIIAYGDELVYHRLETIKYLPLSQSPENSLVNVVEEVGSKLMSLGDKMVQRFLEEIKKDSEICPSKEAKDTVASSFSGQRYTGGREG